MTKKFVKLRTFTYEDYVINNAAHEGLWKKSSFKAQIKLLENKTTCLEICLGNWNYIFGVTLEVRPAMAKTLEVIQKLRRKYIGSIFTTYLQQKHERKSVFFNDLTYLGDPSTVRAPL